jgi:hypothetical protein
MKNLAEIAQPPRIKAILSENFVFTDEMAEILSLGFAGGKNILVFGPGGHGKSEMVKSVIEGLGLQDDTFYQFFGEGMDEARLFGGLDFKKLEDEKVLEYHPEKSFLNSRVAVFEELFDAPASVLLALKDVLTAKELRNGAQRFKMRTEVIIVLTNKDPSEISELGASAHALVERFPLKMNLDWSDYSAKAYLAMFEKVAPKMGHPILNGFKAILAEVVAKSTAEACFVSPRTAVHAYQVCQASARMRGADHLEQEDLRALRFVEGLAEMGQEIQAELEAAMARAEANQNLGQYKAEYQTLVVQMEQAEQSASPIKCNQVVLRARALEDKLSEMAVTDELTEERDALRSQIGRFAGEALEKSLGFTRV